MENCVIENKVKLSYEDTILCKVELDHQFLSEIREIANKKQSEQQSFFDDQQFETSNQTCEQINQKAQWHAEANLINKNNIQTHEQVKTQNLSCECGCKKEKGDSLSIWTNEQRILSLGSGVILLFFYLRHIIILLGMFIISYGIFSVVLNILFTSYDDANEACFGKIGLMYGYCWFSEVTSIRSKRQNELLLIFQYIMGAITVLVWTLGIRFISKLGEIKNKEIINYLDSSAHYSIRIDNLPYGQYEQLQLLEYLKYLWSQQIDNEANQQNKKQMPPIKGIQVVYNMQECRKEINVLAQLSTQMISCLEKNKFKFSNQISQDRIHDYRRIKKEFIEKLIKLQKMRESFLNDSTFRAPLSTSFTILEFHTEKDQRQFLDGLQVVRNPIQDALLPKYELGFKNKMPLISSSPEPSDILWLNVEKKQSYFRVIIIWIVTFTILYIGYAFVSYIQTLALLKLVDSIVSTIILQLLNRLIWFWLSLIVAVEHNNTKTQAIISSMKKSVIAQTINIIVNPILAIFVNNRNLYGVNGLSGMALTYQFIMLFMMFIYNILNPFSLIKKLILRLKCSRNRIIKYYCKSKEDVPQYSEMKPLLAFYQGPQFPIAGSYVYVTTAVSHALFYCHIQPTILIIAFFNMIVFTLIMKYMLYKRCKMPQLTDQQIFNFATFLVNCSAAYYGIGSIFFYWIDKDAQLRNITNIIPSIVCLILWFFLNLDIGNHVQNFVDNAITLLKKHTQKSKKQGKSNNNNKKKTSFHFNHMLSDSMTADNRQFYWRRRECYYIDSNANSLLEFESVLKKTKKETIYLRGKSLRTFCESFSSQKNNEIFQASNNSSSPVFIPFFSSELRSQTTKKEVRKKQQFSLIPVIKSKEKRIVRFEEFDSECGNNKTKISQISL